MNNIVDWELYDSLYSEVIEKDEFERYEREAEAKVRSVIGPIRWNSVTESTFGYGILQECVMYVINALIINETSGVGKGISSVSNDGYSESYAQTTAEEIDEGLKKSIISMLSGTGLVGAY